MNTDVEKLQETIDICERAIMNGVLKGMSYDELNRLLTYATALIVLKADLQHANKVESGCKDIITKYLEEG